MKKLFGALGALAFVLTSTGAAGAGLSIDTTLTLDPDSGPARTTFTVSGTDCTAVENGDMSVEVYAPDAVEMMVEASPDENGDWSADLTVPADAMDGDEILVDADCIETYPRLEANSFQGFRAPQGDCDCDVRSYDQAVFTVTPSPTTTEDTTSTTEATTTTTEDDEDVDAADAAQPTVAEPTFTG